MDYFALAQDILYAHPVVRGRLIEQELLAVNAEGYAATEDALTRRIVELGPIVLTLTDAWQLFKVDGFKCDDIGPSLAQAQWSLAKAKSILQSEPGVSLSPHREEQA